MGLTRDDYALRDVAALPTRERIDRVIRRTEPVQHQRLLEELKTFLFEVEFTVDGWIRGSGLQLSSTKEALELILDCPPSVFHKSCVTETAGRLLSQTDLSMEKIADLVGFSSKQAFLRSFRCATGRAPAGYRRVLRLYPGTLTRSGRDLMSSEVAIQVQHDELPGSEACELLRRVLSLLTAYCASLRGAAAYEPEAALARELLAQRLGPAPGARLVALCRLFFTTSALDDVLAQNAGASR